MSTHGIKYSTMAAALAVVAGAFQRTADVYGNLNSQDANFRDLQQQVNAALALPEDPSPDTPPAPVVLQAMPESAVEGLVTSVLARLDQHGASIVTALTLDIEKSDVSVLDAIAQTRSDLLAAVTPAAEEEPAAQAA